MLPEFWVVYVLLALAGFAIAARRPRLTADQKWQAWLERDLPSSCSVAGHDYSHGVCLWCLESHRIEVVGRPLHKRPGWRIEFSDGAEAWARAEDIIDSDPWDAGKRAATIAFDALVARPGRNPYNDDPSRRVPAVDVECFGKHAFAGKPLDPARTLI